MKSSRNLFVNVIKIFSLLLCMAAVLTTRGFCAGLVSNLSPSEFDAQYNAYVKNASEIFGKQGAVDYSTLDIKDVWKDQETYTYWSYIDKNFENAHANCIVKWGQDIASKPGIKMIMLIADKNVSNREDKLLVETKFILAVLGITSTDSDEIRRVITTPNYEHVVYSKEDKKRLHIVSNVNEAGSVMVGITAD